MFTLRFIKVNLVNISIIKLCVTLSVKTGLKEVFLHIRMKKNKN